VFLHLSLRKERGTWSWTGYRNPAEPTPFIRCPLYLPRKTQNPTATGQQQALEALKCLAVSWVLLDF